MEQARSLRSERILVLGLFLASNLLDAALPEQVLQRVQADSVVQSLGTQLCERLFRETAVPPVVFEMQSHLLALRTREHLQDRVRYYL